MFANTYQSGFISIFYSVGSNPLQLWDKQVKNGHIRRVVDDEVRSLVLEISGTNVATTYITCPIKPRMSLGIKLPFLVMIIKNMKKYFTFEIQILDDKDMHRRFRVSNFQSTTKVRPFCTTMPIGLSSGWNQVQFNLADFTKRAYGSTYLETTRVQIHANARIRRIYFSDILYSDDELPNEYKLFLPTPGTQTARPIKEKKESVSKEKKERKPTLEEEPPSVVPPSPEGDESLLPTAIPGTPEEPFEKRESEVIAEPPSENLEEVAEAEATSEPPTTATTEGEGEGEEESPIGGEAFEGAPPDEMADEAAVEESPPPEAEDVPADEAGSPKTSVAEVSAAEVSAEEAPAAEAPAEEAAEVAEAPETEEPPPAEGDAPAEEPPKEVEVAE